MVLKIFGARQDISRDPSVEQPDCQEEEEEEEAGQEEGLLSAAEGHHYQYMTEGIVSRVKEK